MSLSGGWFVQLHWSTPAIAAALGIPMLLGGAALITLNRRLRRAARPIDPRVAGAALEAGR